jgi:hypothetical protein
MAMTRLKGNGGLFITLGSLDEDYVYTTDYPDYSKGIRVQSIQYFPSDQLDVCSIKDYTGSLADSPIIFNVSSDCNFETKYFHGALMKPYYEVDGVNTCAASANARIIIHLGGYSL